MLVPDEVRKCVVFIGYHWTSGFRLVGTAFLVKVDIVGTPDCMGYLVTAKHVIDGIRQYSMDDKVGIRFNLKGIGARVITNSTSDWFSHPTDPSVDVAVARLVFSQDMDHLAFPDSAFATDEVIASHKINVGDDVFFTGLFINHAGTNRNVPIVRIGNIAAMPEERVAVRGGFGAIEAFLVEARSIGGLSGSPVFVMLGAQRRDGSVILGNGNQFFLLGLMHGHFDLPQTTEDLVVSDAPGGGSVNVGIGIVVPARQILQVLNSPIFVSDREQHAAHWRAAHAGVPDSAPPTS